MTTRLSLLNSPFVVGFDNVERVFDRVAKSANEGYPPYNIEQIGEDTLRITLAVAGFTRDDLSVTVEENQLIIRGRQEDDPARIFVHRGIAARQFQRAFVLAEGIEIIGADLDNGLLSIDLQRPRPNRVVQEIEIGGRAAKKSAVDVTGGSDT
ncbi:MAG: Hsp20 family protein [Alphaproteobacteria bacterium]